MQPYIAHDEAPETIMVYHNLRAFVLFLQDLDEKMTSAGYRRKQNKKKSETVQRADNLFGNSEQ